MTTTRIDSLSLGDDALAVLRGAFLYDDAVLAAGTAADVAFLPAGLRIRLRAAFPNLAAVEAPAEAAAEVWLGVEGREALARLGGPRHLLGVKTLRSMGIDRLVLGEDDKLDRGASEKYHDDGAPLVQWYGAGRVVRVDEVGGKLPHHPRTGARLTRGDVVPWITVSREGLVAAAGIFGAPDILAGESDRAVFEDVKVGGPMWQAVTARLRDKDFRARAEAVIDGTAGRPSGAAMGERGEAAQLGPLPRAAVTGLADMIGRMFEADEIQRVISYLPDGERLVDALPRGGASKAEIVHKVAELLVRWGYIRDAEARRLLRECLTAARPRRVVEIDHVLNGYG